MLAIPGASVAAVRFEPTGAVVRPLWLHPASRGSIRRSPKAACHHCGQEGYSGQHSAPVVADDDLYAVLGVTPTASNSEIDKGYRDQMRRWHPDVCRAPGAEGRAKAINYARDILRNPRVNTISAGSITVYAYEALIKQRGKACHSCLPEFRHARPIRAATEPLSDFIASPGRSGPNLRRSCRD